MVVADTPAAHGSGLGDVVHGIVGRIPALVRGITGKAGQVAAAAAKGARDRAVQAPHLLEQGKQAALGALQSKARDLTAKALVRVSEHATAGLPPTRKRPPLRPYAPGPASC